MYDIFPTYIKTLNFNLEHIYSRIREKRILVSREKRFRLGSPRS